MNRLIELLSGRRGNHSRGIQRALREIDTAVLARIMLRLDGRCREVLRRNMTAKARAMLDTSMELERIRGNPPEGGTDEEAEFLRREIEARTTEEYAEVQRYPSYEAPILLETREDAVATFRRLSEFAHAHGLMALDGLGSRTDNPLFGKALELVLLGLEPFLLEEILRNALRRELRRMEEVGTMIVEGFLSIQQGHHPQIVAERLQASTGGE